MRFIFSLFTLGAGLFLSSCDKSRIFEENKELEKFSWTSNNRLLFEFDVKDQSQTCNMYINIRNNSSYPYSNLFLFLDTRYPDGKVSRDTLECLLADEQGNWLGKGSGDVIDNQIPFKRNFRFKQKGRYKFFMEQAMRVSPLEGVIAAGIRIEKSE
jgi:gliding motility-associated lipoprotein GldH